MVIDKALKGSPILSDASVSSEVKNGVVRLTGTAGPNDRLVAVRIARGTPGVRSVVNEISIQ